MTSLLLCLSVCLYSSVLNCTVLYCTVLYCTVSISKMRSFECQQDDREIVFEVLYDKQKAFTAHSDIIPSKNALNTL
jgi:hypothetical protein